MRKTVRKTIPDRSSQVHKFMLEYQRRHGKTPCLREICEGTGMKTLSQAHQVMYRLCRHALVVPQPHGMHTTWLAVSAKTKQSSTPGVFS